MSLGVLMLLKLGPSAGRARRLSKPAINRADSKRSARFEDTWQARQRLTLGFFLDDPLVLLDKAERG